MAVDRLVSGRILIVDDQQANVRLLELTLERGGFTNVKSTTDPRLVMSLFREWRPDLILLDLFMPHLDGTALMQLLAAEIPRDDYLPILVLTAAITPEVKRRALAAGAKDFVTKPFDPLEVLLRIRNLLQTRFLHRELQDHNRSLEETVRERTEKLLQTEKLAAMGQLLAGVAHELNNPLSIVIGRTMMLRKALDGGPLAIQTDKIARAAERCGRIVKNFLALARQRPPERQQVSLNQVVREAAELLAYPLRVDDVEVTLDLAEDLPVLWADSHQLHQVIVNLITNAHHAMRKTLPPRRLSLTTRFDADAGRVRLVVSDTGPGIPPASQMRIFEPFFTTKPPGQGTGLGLSLCKAMIEEHHGSIRLQAQAGLGAVFVVDLPLDPRRTTPPEAQAPESPLPVRERRILVVDDEPEIADVLADMLSADGHNVDRAANGVAALSKIAGCSYDVILSDIRMPELDGPGLYRELERGHPELVPRLVFVTGDSLSPETREFLERVGARCLGKPFSPEEVQRVVRLAGQAAEA